MTFLFRSSMTKVRYRNLRKGLLEVDLGWACYITACWSTEVLSLPSGRSIPYKRPKPPSAASRWSITSFGCIRNSSGSRAVLIIHPFWTVDSLQIFTPKIKGYILEASLGHHKDVCCIRMGPVERIYQLWRRKFLFWHSQLGLLHLWFLFRSTLDHQRDSGFIQFRGISFPFNLVLGGCSLI